MKQKRNKDLTPKAAKIKYDSGLGMEKTSQSKAAPTRQSVKPIATVEVDERRFFNRELSWLDFNRRVLGEAGNSEHPILERLKFSAIFSTNLDEFFMIRVSGIKEQLDEGVTHLSNDGKTPAEQFKEIGKKLRPMLKLQQEMLQKDILPELAKAGIKVERYDELTLKDRRRLDKYFKDNLFPVLTPQSVDSSHPFPYISSLSLNIGLYIEPNRQATKRALRHLFRQKRFARIKVPPNVPRLIPVGTKKGRYTLLEDVIKANVSLLFPQMKAGEAFLFRVTRDADIELREDEAGDLMRSLEQELLRRGSRFPVRLEVSADMPDKMRQQLLTGVGLTEDDVYNIDGFVDIPDLMHLYSNDKPLLKDESYMPFTPSEISSKASRFDAIKKRDILLHHPYMAFSIVTDLIAEAADDPNVLAIKICLYRTGKDSPIVESLIRAVQMGKQVTALVELKARFDENNNIEWARRLENEGVHVVYGINSLKTHSKVLLIVRRERDHLMRYMHIATGNYNPTTARIYTDLGLLTCNEEIGSDATSLFNFLTGYSQESKYKRLIVAPIHLREQMAEMVRREAEHAKAGRQAKIILKMNSITDTGLVEELYKASEAGVSIDLIVRGVCVLRPGVKGLSSNIRVRSVVGRFLEHSRVFYFANGGGDAEEVFIGSADWMSRNLNRRVEVLTPILDAEIKDYLKNDLLAAYLKDNVNAHVLRPDGTYRKVAAGNAEPFNSQLYFIGRRIDH